MGKLSKSYLKEVAERKKFQSGGFSTQGYKRNSPDVNNPYNVIPSNQITMRGVDFPVLGVDNMGNRRLMEPGNDYTFPGNYVTEFPIKNMGSKRFGQVGMQKKDIPKYVEDRYQVQNTTDNTYSVPFTPLPKPVPVRNVKAPANLTNSRYQPSTTDNTYLVPPTALPKPTPAQLLRDFEIAVETEATEKEQQRLQAEREAAAKTREAVVEFGDESAKFTFPDGKTKAWKDMDWREQAYVSGKNLGSWSAGNWTDYINPAAMIGSLAESLGSAPYVARETDSIMPYVTGIGSPLLTGALGGIGAKTTGQFVNNLANPLAGVSLKSAGEYLTTQTPLKNAYKLNPRAVNLEKIIAKENLPTRQIFGDEAVESFKKYGPSVQPEKSQIEQLVQFARLPEDKAFYEATNEVMNLKGLPRTYDFPYFTQGNLWYKGNKKYMPGKEHIIIPKKGSDLTFYPAGEQSIIDNYEDLSQSLIDSYSRGRRVLAPYRGFDNPENFRLFEGTPHWWRGHKEVTNQGTYQMGGTIGIPRVNGQVVSSQPQPLTSVRRTRGPLQKNNKGDVKTMPNQQVKQVLKYSKQKPNKI